VTAVTGANCTDADASITITVSMEISFFMSSAPDKWVLIYLADKNRSAARIRAAQR
jgi:hypothetical protein